MATSRKSEEVKQFTYIDSETQAFFFKTVLKILFTFICKKEKYQHSKLAKCCSWGDRLYVTIAGAESTLKPSLSVTDMTCL